jgi:hypothetical protein
MRKYIAVVAIALATMLGVGAVMALKADATPDMTEVAEAGAVAAGVTIAVGIAKASAPAHDSATNAAVCKMIDAGEFGPEPNEVGVAAVRGLHGFGLHWVDCCFWSLRYGFKVHARYLIGWADIDWITGDPWCS